VYIGDGYVDNLPRYPGLLEAVKSRLESAQDRALSILSDRRKELEALARELDARGFLSKEEIHATVSLVSAKHALEVAE
jgi:hypothetical protein